MKLLFIPFPSLSLSPSLSPSLSLHPTLPFNFNLFQQIPSLPPILIPQENIPTYPLQLMHDIPNDPVLLLQLLLQVHNFSLTFIRQFLQQ